jgi:hypothetical protein
VAKLASVLASISFANQTTLQIEAGMATRRAKCLVGIRDRRRQLGTAVAAIMIDAIGEMVDLHLAYLSGLRAVGSAGNGIRRAPVLADRRSVFSSRRHFVARLN